MAPVVLESSDSLAQDRFGGDRSVQWTGLGRGLEGSDRDGGTRRVWLAAMGQVETRVIGIEGRMVGQVEGSGGEGSGCREELNWSWPKESAVFEETSESSKNRPNHPNCPQQATVSGNDTNESSSNG